MQRQIKSWAEVEIRDRILRKLIRVLSKLVSKPGLSGSTLSRAWMRQQCSEKLASFVN